MRDELIDAAVNATTPTAARANTAHKAIKSTPTPQDAAIAAREIQRKAERKALEDTKRNLTRTRQVLGVTQAFLALSADPTVRAAASILGAAHATTGNLLTALNTADKVHSVMTRPEHAAPKPSGTRTDWVDAMVTGVQYIEGTSNNPTHHASLELMGKLTLHMQELQGEQVSQQDWALKVALKFAGSTNSNSGTLSVTASSSKGKSKAAMKLNLKVTQSKKSGRTQNTGSFKLDLLPGSQLHAALDLRWLSIKLKEQNGA